MTPAPIWIGTSWKMNGTRGEARAYAAALRAASGVAERMAGGLGDPRLRPFVIPPFTALAEVAAALAGGPVVVGAQNMHWAEAGAWTGEVSAAMVRDCGATLVELGHSERRSHFGETDATVALKVAAAVRHRLIPLICIGELESDKQAGRADEVLARQVEAALTPVAGTDAEVLVAYEPVWAIGEHGVPASPDYASARHARIGEVAAGIMGRPVPVLYGGSVTAANCAALIASPHVGGLFVGRSAWSAEGFLDILARASRALSSEDQS